MDITAPTAATAPTEGAPTVAAKAAAGAFTGLLAAAMEGVPSDFLAPPPAVPLAPALTIPVAPTSVVVSVATPFVVPEAKVVSPDVKGTQNVLPGIVTAIDSVAAPVAPEGGVEPSGPKTLGNDATKSRGRPTIPVGPAPPPPSTTVLASEKEAPTPAPNAPVETLDRIPEASEDAQAVPLDAPPAIPSPIPAIPAILAPIVASPAAVPTVVEAPPRSEAVSPLTVGTSLAEAAAPPLTRAAGNDAPLVASAPKLAAAQDLGVVPQVVSPPALAPATASPAPALAPNARVARVAERAAPEIEAVAAKPAPAPRLAETKVPPVEAFVAEAQPAADDASAGDDAPKDPAPQVPAAPLAKTTATERPEAGADRPAVDRHLVVRQVADRIENLAAAHPRDGVTIHLEPRDLGTVTLMVKGLSSALDVQVTASDDRVRQSLDASRPELAQALSPRGIELREFRVAVAPNAPASTSTGGNPNPNPNPEGRARPQSPSSDPLKASGRRSSTNAHPTRSSGRGVDLLV